MNFCSPSRSRSRCREIAVLAATLTCAIAVAQDRDKSVVAEPVPVVPAFNQWLGSLPASAPSAVSSGVTTLTWPAAGSVAVAGQATFEPAAVILGKPELPLLGAGRVAVRSWGHQFNYQGVQLRLMVLDAVGRRLDVRGLGAMPKARERFKIRVTPTFDAVADLSLVVGEAWTSQRAGQFYPQPGLSVALKAGETVDLPVDTNQYFVMSADVSERLLLSIRHPSALGDARSPQPAYRQDSKTASGYLQLVPRGTHPSVEQLLAVAR